jgi:hypothetical protein
MLDLSVARNGLFPPLLLATVEACRCIDDLDALHGIESVVLIPCHASALREGKTILPNAIARVRRGLRPRQLYIP